MLREILASGLRPGDVFSRTAQGDAEWHEVVDVRRWCTGPDAIVDVTSHLMQYPYFLGETVWIEERGEQWTR
jgi:hypothetical protein